MGGARKAYVDVCTIDAPSGFFSDSPPPRILAYMSDTSRFLVRIEENDDVGLRTLEQYRGDLRDSCRHVLADTVQEGRSLRRLGKELPTVLATFGELASTPVPVTNMNERARLSALKYDGGGSIARTFAAAMEQ